MPAFSPAHHHVFVSYSSQNAWTPFLIALIKESFLKFDVGSFVAHEDTAPGEVWPEVLREALNKASILVVLWSPEAEHSEFVVNEVSTFYRRYLKASRRRKDMAMVFVSVSKHPVPKEYAERFQAVEWAAPSDLPPQGGDARSPQLLADQAEFQRGFERALVRTLQGRVDVLASELRQIKMRFVAIAGGGLAMSLCFLSGQVCRERALDLAFRLEREVPVGLSGGESTSREYSVTVFRTGLLGTSADKWFRVADKRASTGIETTTVGSSDALVGCVVSRREPLQAEYLENQWIVRTWTNQDSPDSEAIPCSFSAPTKEPRAVLCVPIFTLRSIMVGALCVSAPNATPPNRAVYALAKASAQDFWGLPIAISPPWLSPDTSS